mgnify:CR=1 FL=1
MRIFRALATNLVAIKTLYLIRHGESLFNKLFEIKKNPSVHLDSYLTPKGINQALDLKTEIRELKLGEIYCSTANRTLQTAWFSLAPSLRSKLHFCPSLVERIEHPKNLWNNPLGHQIEFPDFDFRRVQYDFVPCSIPETPLCFQTRILSTWKALESGTVCSTLTLVGHCDFFSYLLEILIGKRVILNNAEIIRVDFG